MDSGYEVYPPDDDIDTSCAAIYCCDGDCENCLHREWDFSTESPS